DAPKNLIFLMLGCLERWRYLTLGPAPSDVSPVPMRFRRLSGAVLRDGWGSGRGIRTDWIIHATPMGARAQAIWPSLFGFVEDRWRARWSDEEIDTLAEALMAIAGVKEALPDLLERALSRFAAEVDHRADAPLELSANVLRVLADGPVPIAELPDRTGVS